MMFKLPEYIPPDFHTEHFAGSPDVHTEPAPMDGVVPENFYAFFLNISRSTATGF